MSGTIVTGDDVALPVTLRKDGQTFAINLASTVRAAVVSLDRSETLIAAVTLSNVATGADWANSLVVAEFSSAESADATTTGPALLEIQVDDSGKTTWFLTVEITAGSIS